MARILLVDDEVNIIKTISSILQDEGHVVFSSGRGGEALEFLRKNEVDLALLDIWLPDYNGIDLLEQIKGLYPETAIIMISGHGSIDIAVRSTKMGAFDFLQKPMEMERVITSVNNALEQARLRKENLNLKRGVYTDDEMIGTSAGISEIKGIIDTAASTNARVFITGESGTGKELVARAIYRRSKRSDRPFVKVNCAAIPNELIESELFGHEKGSFTGALSRRLGKFELANKGTLFLDEVCTMSLSAQAKVLRSLQEQQFERVGGNETISVDVRVISATNLDAKKAIEDGVFREDLYYRLNVIPIVVPPLSERKEDIPQLAEYFLRRFSNEHGVGEKEITDDGIGMLAEHPWPGNVRELKNVIERLVIMVPRDTITAQDVQNHLEHDAAEKASRGEVSPLKKAREEFERQYIIEALQQAGKNVSEASKKLGIERTNLYRKMKQYGINPEDL
ncbi:MAG: sigma-54-dependent Fis family transcriptional regulator [Spirochaetes bacterium]|nr:sigma-54-dependent Fis family transcriptional regulator [Spirochaetota bacterium]